MPRNLDRRLELMVPIVDAACRQQLLEILNKSIKDSAKSWKLQNNGKYTRVTKKGKKTMRSQEQFYRTACEAAGEIIKQQRTRFEPHRPEN